MRREKDQIGTLKFIAIGVVLMVVADQFLFDGTRPYIESAKTERAAQLQAEMDREGVDGPPVRVDPPGDAEFFEELPADAMPGESGEAITPEIPKQDETEKDAEIPVLPPVSKGAPPQISGKAKIAIIIDDIGMDIKRSRAVMELPAPITMAILPYAPKAKDMAAAAKVKGHPLIIHAPMQAEDATVNIGPGGLKIGMNAQSFDDALLAMFASFDGYEGINNHMGSRLTRDAASMERVMMRLAERGLFFVDSKTSGQSVAGAMAAHARIPYAERDVFLDHVDSSEFVARALKETEKIALRRGYAIAIGHPKDNTIAGLRAWIPTLKTKGIELVPVKALLTKAVLENTPELPEEILPEQSSRATYSAEQEEAISAPAFSGQGLQLHLPRQ